MSGELDANPAEARVAAAAAERREARRAVRNGPAGTSLREVLVGIAERDERVVIGVGFGRSHRVRVTGVGTDAVLATNDAGTTVMIGIDAVLSVATQSPVTAMVPVDRAHGRGAEPGNLSQARWSMADIMAQWSSDGRRITARRGGDQTSGELVAVGLDVAVIASDAAGGTTYVRLDSITEISVSESSST